MTEEAAFLALLKRAEQDLEEGKVSELDDFLASL